MPQQRTSARRRVRPNFLGAQYQTVDWQPVAYLGTAVRFALMFAGTGVQDTTRDYSLNGIPQMSWFDLTTFPITAAWVKPYLELDWGVAVDNSQPLTLAANDPALRGPLGEYLNGKVIYGVPGPPTPQDSVISGLTLAPPDIQFTLTDAGQTLFIQGLGNIYNVTTAEQPYNFSSVPGMFTAHFTTPPSSGDQIDFTGGAGAFLNTSGGTLQPTTIFVP